MNTSDLHRLLESMAATSILHRYGEGARQHWLTGIGQLQLQMLL